MKQKGFVIMLLCATLMTLTGCKTNKEAFNAAYERAKAKQEVAEQTVAQPAAEQTEVVEVVETPVSVREASEAITIVDNKEVTGNYGVVVGSFINRTNAENLLKTMQGSGYPDAVLGKNAKDMYRVIVSFYSRKFDAQVEVNRLYAKFPDAWILIKE